MENRIWTKRGRNEGTKGRGTKLTWTGGKYVQERIKFIVNMCIFLGKTTEYYGFMIPKSVHTNIVPICSNADLKISLEVQFLRLNIIYPWRFSLRLSFFLVCCLRRHDCQSGTIRKLTAGSAGFSRQFQPYRIWSRISEIQRKEGDHLKIKMWTRLSSTEFEISLRFDTGCTNRFAIW